MAKILVCDDSAFMRLLLKQIIMQMGHEVVAEASNGKQAFELYQQHSPELTTMDITMPVLDGIEAVKLIREHDITAKIVMVTAIGQRQVIRDAIMAGASDFIIKPFETLQVARVVRKFVKH